MRVAVDTNVLLRFLLADEPVQHEEAVRILKAAERVIIPIVALCEAAWVLSRTYGLSRSEIGEMVRALTSVDSVEYDVELVEAGLVLLDAGGDFADGVIARQGQLRRSDLFVSFDRKAVKLLQASGMTARTPDAIA